MRCFPVRLTILFAAIFCISAQEPNAPSKSPPVNESKGMPPRATAGDYASQATAGSVTIGAEFTGHSVPRVEGPLSTEDYVVVETGFFGPPGAHLKLSVDDFSL